MEMNTNKKLVFEENLDSKNNRGYIKTLDSSFLNPDSEKRKKFKEQVDKCANNDIDNIIQKICTSEQTVVKKKLGIYVDDENKNKMSNLMCQWCDLIDYKNIL